MTRLWRGWSRWAFNPIDTAPMAALRIAVGVLTFGWALSWLPDAGAFLSDSGVQPSLPSYESGAWAVQLGPPYISLLILLVASIALTLGWRTRVSAVVVFVLLLQIQRRDPWVWNSGDLLLRELAFFVMLMPSGETWSLDARRRRRQRLRSPWALRLAQMQISALYLFSVWTKLRGTSWNDGTAVGIALQLEDLQRFAVPTALATSLLVSASLTYSSLFIEAALALGLWLPRLRYWVMAAGIGLHMGIEATLLIGWFSLAAISSYLSFVPAAHLRAAVRWLRQFRVTRLPLAAPQAEKDVVGRPRRTGSRQSGGAADAHPEPTPVRSSAARGNYRSRHLGPGK